MRKAKAFALWLIFGFLGFHRFYMGYEISASIMLSLFLFTCITFVCGFSTYLLFLCFFGILCFWWLHDFKFVLSNENYPDKNNEPEKIMNVKNKRVLANTLNKFLDYEMTYKEKASELVVMIRRGYEIPQKLDKDGFLQNYLIRYAECVNWCDNADDDTIKSMAGLFDALLKYEGVKPKPSVKEEIQYSRNAQEIQNWEKACILQQENPLEFLTEILYGWHLYLGGKDILKSKLLNMINKIEERLNIKFSLIPLTASQELPEDNFKKPLLSVEELKNFHELVDFKSITEIIQCKKTGLKNKKEYFYDEKQNKCSTEKAVLNYLKLRDYSAIYAENTFWNALAILSYFEEIYSQNWNGFTPDVNNMFSSFMYKENKGIFDKKTQYIENCNLRRFIQEQINDFGFMNINRFRCQDSDYIEYLQENIDFLDYIPNEIFVKITSRMITCLSEYGRGLPDLLIFKDNKICFVEVKRLKEKLREAQEDWIVYFRKNNIPIKIIRVEGV